MIKYWLGPHSKKELSISFDQDSANDFIRALIKLKGNRQPNSAPAIYKKAATEINSEIYMSLTDDEALEFIEIRDNRVHIEFSDESIEYAIFKISNFLKEGDFSPAEYYSFSAKKEKGNIQIYFIKAS